MLGAQFPYLIVPWRCLSCSVIVWRIIEWLGLERTFKNHPENLQKESEVLGMFLDCVWHDSHPDLTDLECISQCLLQPILCGFKAGLFQELPKYLRGYHKCSKDEAVQLAGLIYKVRFNNDRTQLATIPKILKELVPDNLLRAISSDEWKKVRTSAFITHTTATELYEKRKILSHATFLI